MVPVTGAHSFTSDHSRQHRTSTTPAYGFILMNPACRCTGVTAVVRDRQVWVAHVGDSRAILCKSNGAGSAQSLYPYSLFSHCSISLHTSIILCLPLCSWEPHLAQHDGHKCSGRTD